MDINRLSSLCLDISTEWQDIQITYKNKRYKEKTVIIPLIYTGSNGIYVFLPENNKNDILYIYQELEKTFNIRGDGLFLFCYKSNDSSNVDELEDESVFVYDSIAHTFLEFDNLYDAFDIFYYNHYIPQADLPYYKFDSFEDYFEIQEISIERDEDEDGNKTRYVRPIISSQKLEFIEKKLEEMLQAGRKEGKYTYYPDGSMTVNKLVKSPDAIRRPWESYMEQSTYDYPCSDEDGNKTFLLTTLTGWFGFHKFRERKIFQGLLYLLSCGGCCMFYFLDVIAVMTGNYFTTNSHYFRTDSGKVDRVKTKTYNRPVKNKKLFLVFILMIPLTLGLLKYAYVPAYKYGTDAVSSIVQEVYKNKIVEESGINGFENISEEDLEEYFNSIEQDK